MSGAHSIWSLIGTGVSGHDSGKHQAASLKENSWPNRLKFSVFFFKGKSRVN